MALIQSELKDLRNRDAVHDISNAITEAASQSKIDASTRDNVLYWLTETNPDVRQMILVQTIEELLKMENCREATTIALVKISSQENVDMVMEWVHRKILTLNQAVYVLLFPDSSAALMQNYQYSEIWHVFFHVIFPIWFYLKCTLNTLFC